MPPDTNDKGDNKMILGAVHRSPGICLIAEETPRKPQPGDRLMKGLCGHSSYKMRVINEIGATDIPYFELCNKLRYLGERVALNFTKRMQGKRSTSTPV